MKNFETSGASNESTELTKRLLALEYVPNANGPDRLFQEATTIQGLANGLGTGVLINDEFLIDILKNKINVSGHSKTLLAAINYKWNEVAEDDQTYMAFTELYDKELRLIWEQGDRGPEAGSANLSQEMIEAITAEASAKILSDSHD